MASVFNFFSPKDKKFQPLLEQASANLLKISETLVIALNTDSLKKRKSIIKEVEKFEQAGDDITHTILLNLEKTFITPFDREDIYALVNSLDDIADYIYTSSINLDMYNIKNTTKAMVDLAVLLSEMCNDLNIAILELRTFKNTKLIADICERINIGESKADHICNTAIGHLFETETDAIELIKQKDMLQTLEMAIDKCDDVADVLETLLIKNA